MRFGSALLLLFVVIFLSGCGKNGKGDGLLDSEELPAVPGEPDLLGVEFPYVYAQDPYKASDNVVLPGFTHKRAEVYETEGRQGVAWADGMVYVSGSKSLAVYDKDRNKIASNEKPFKAITEKVNHIGDIDVYNGEIYAGVESFAKGNSKNLLLAVFDAKTLELKEYRTIAEESEQIEISGITVDYDHNILWICSWEQGNSGRYLYRYDLFTKEYLGRVQLQASPQEIQGIAYFDGWIYISSDDGFADLDQPDHIYRCQVDPGKTAFRVYEEQVLDDVIHYGELEGITFNREKKQLLVLYNRGRHINQGIGSDYYDGYIREIHEIYCYDWERVIRPMDYSEECCWADLPWLDTQTRTGEKAEAKQGGLGALTNNRHKQEKREFEADAFLILPEINLNARYPDNMDINNIADAERYSEELAYEKGILSTCTDVFAPFYRQANLGCYIDEEGFVCGDFADVYDSQAYDEVAYTDVRSAFIYYMENYNNGRPVVLFGSSQGAELVLRLLKEFGDDDIVKDRLVAAYAIGAGVRAEDLDQYPYLKMAKEEGDTGVIVSFRTQAEGAGGPKEKEFSINPLNWAVDGTAAGAGENKGSRIGKTGDLQPGFCGAYLDESTGRLIATDLAGTNTMYKFYYEGAGLYPLGDFRMCETGMFYENLKENVAVRMGNFK